MNFRTLTRYGLVHRDERTVLLNFDHIAIVRPMRDGDGQFTRCFFAELTADGSSEWVDVTESLAEVSRLLLAKG